MGLQSNANFPNRTFLPLFGRIRERLSCEVTHEYSADYYEYAILENGEVWYSRCFGAGIGGLFFFFVSFVLGAIPGLFIGFAIYERLLPEPKPSIKRNDNKPDQTPIT